MSEPSSAARREWTSEEQESINRTVRNVAAGLMNMPLVAPVKNVTQPARDSDDAAKAEQ